MLNSRKIPDRTRIILSISVVSTFSVYKSSRQMNLLNTNEKSIHGLHSHSKNLSTTFLVGTKTFFQFIVPYVGGGWQLKGIVRKHQKVV